MNKKPENVLEQDLHLAVRLQQSMLPATIETPSWEMLYCFKPCLGLSGDFIDIYDFSDDFFDTDGSDDNIGVLLLDASGHGISAALIAAIAKPIFFRAHRENKDNNVARAMYEANIEMMGMIGETFNYLTGISVRLKNDGFSYCNASHPLLLFHRHRTGRNHFLENDGTFLGSRIVHGALKSRKIRAETGDIIFLYTDGLREIRLEDGRELDFHEIGKIIAESGNMSLEEIRDAILEAVKNFRGDLNNLPDDITFCLIRRR